MNIIEEKKIKTLISKEIKSLKNKISQATKSSEIVFLYQSSVGRLSRIDAIQQQAIALNFKNRLLERKIKLEFALKRVLEKKFGYCCNCEEKIEKDRLSADIASVFCNFCALERETN